MYWPVRSCHRPLRGQYDRLRGEPQAASPDSDSRHSRVLDSLRTIAGAGHEEWDSLRLCLGLARLCALLKKELCLGFVAGNAQVGVLEHLPFLALPGAQSPSRFLAQER